MNTPPSLPRDWILLMDLAASRHSKELHLPEHIRVLYVDQGATAYLQPLDRCLFKIWKDRLTHAANERLAEIALGPEPPHGILRFLVAVVEVVQRPVGEGRHRGHAGSHRLPGKKHGNTQVCDALRCSGLHVLYTDAFNEFTTLPEKVG